ncbi:4'-phosphopantetheinyl transferase family protein [Streptomyces sp. MB09-02B]|uniref:4'-phosphopantetheinyl transferase family protein n=1 Tax=Streptomyces sp. MB09-02B TaxID=3028667 RepID=UPI0029BA7877|nr:4'-phosphopantetheinyl transferase superfamily protein [Streptomyces sp. MB09-02B]MDX3642281.1 4'-phosphopantetheinyl transferase superfamily protein [Streptomyces sp. MB09-02B]
MTGAHPPTPGRPSPRPRPGGEEFAVCDDRVDLWLMRSPDPRDGTALDTSELDETEQRRAASFIRPADGLLYATAHVALRRLLSRYTHTLPHAIRFVREPCPGCGGAHGRPALAPTPARPPLHFSLSHSAGVALVGVAAAPVGVDVERLPRQESVTICGKALHPGEQRELAGTPAQELTSRFGQIWTRKEAYLKGIGTGLSRSPAQDYLGADGRRHPPGWTVLDIPCTATHSAAAAVRGPAPGTVDVRWLHGDWLTARGAGGAADRPGPAVPALAC